MSSENNKDLSKLLIEHNSGKKDQNDDKNRKNNNTNNNTINKSPKKSDKKVVRDTIYIKNIPNYYNSVETLSKFYKKFGSIENIQVEQGKMLASVRFMKALDAVKAVNSNKKLFGKEEIFVTLNPEEEPPKKNSSINQNLTQVFNNENKNNSNKEGVTNSNFEEKKDIKKNKPVNSLLEGKFSKFQEMKNKKEKEGLKDMIKKKLANKLKFLLYLKNRIEKTELKNELINEINKIKNYKNEIEKGTFDDTLKEQLEKENLDPSFDYTLILNNLQENMLNYTVLQAKLEVLLFVLICFIFIFWGL